MLIIGIIFLGIFAALAFLMVKIWKSPRIGEAPSAPKESGILVFLNNNARFKNFLKRYLVGDELEANRAYVEELDRLRAEIARLVKENTNIRELHGKAVGHVGQLKEELKDVQKQREAYEKMLHAAHERRIKAQQRADEIERQLQELIKEVEQLYRDNARSGDLGKVKERLGYISDPPLDGKSTPVILPTASDREASNTPTPEDPVNYAAEIVEAQAAEIAKLKTLLITCRQQIVEYLSAKK